MSRAAFVAELTRQYEVLFALPEYTMAARRYTPAALAEKMVTGLATTPTTANKDGAGIRGACKVLGVPYTYAAIAAYLNEVQS